MHRTFISLVVLGIALGALVGCSAPGEVRHPAIEAVADLLELRRDDVRDAAAYEEYFENPELAATLAESGDEETGTPQVPEYEDPYLSAETSATADVAVVWKTDQAFPDWPTATVFSLVLADGRWIVVDALESTAVPDPLPAAAAE